MSLRILHVLDHSLPIHSGYAFRTRAILREQRRLGWETHHLTTPKHPGGKLAQEVVDDLAFHRSTRDEGWFWSLPLVREWATIRSTERRLDDLIPRLRPDILHAHSPALNAVAAILAGRRHRIPVVYEVRAFWEDAAVDHGTAREGGARYRATRALETWALRNADHVTTICEGLKREILARRIRTDVTVVPNAVDANAFEFGQPGDAGLKSSLGLEGRIVLGFIGSFYAYEGLDLLVDALPLILARHPEVRLLLVGGGPAESAIRKAAADRGVVGQVVLTGRVPHQDVHRYYDIVDVLAYPRRPMRLTDLVTPLKPLEAMAQGRLVVASDVGGHRELIRDGETGILFKAGDAASLANAISSLLDRRNHWPAMRVAGRKFIERERTWRSSVRRYRPIFHRLTRGKAFCRGET